MHDDNPQTTCAPATLLDQPSSNPSPPCQFAFYSSNPHHHDMFIYDVPVHKQETGEKTSNSLLGGVGDMTRQPNRSSQQATKQTQHQNVTVILTYPISFAGESVVIGDPS
jgi:hypothetical protein